MPQQQVHVRLVLVGGLLRIQPIAKPILLPPKLLNINSQIVQLQLILHVPIVRDVQATFMMMAQAVPVQRTLAVLLILPAVQMVNTYPQLLQI